MESFESTFLEGSAISGQRLGTFLWGGVAAGSGYVLSDRIELSIAIG